MAAPKGNKFWQLRSKHGRDKLFSTPELMWQAACEYFEWCDDNPLQIEEPVKFQGSGDTMTLNLKQVYTLEGLARYLNCNREYFTQFANNTKDEDFSRIIKDINDVIYQQKFINVSVGIFNPMVICRDLGLKEKSLVGSDPENPLPAAIQFYLPDNGRMKQIQNTTYDADFSLD